MVVWFVLLNRRRARCDPPPSDEGNGEQLATGPKPDKVKSGPAAHSPRRRPLQKRRAARRPFDGRPPQVPADGEPADDRTLLAASPPPTTPARRPISASRCIRAASRCVPLCSIEPAAATSASARMGQRGKGGVVVGSERSAGACGPHLLQADTEGPVGRLAVRA